MLLSPDLNLANSMLNIFCIVAEFLINYYYSLRFHRLFNFYVMKLKIWCNQFELRSRRKEKHEHLKTIYYLSIILA